MEKEFCDKDSWVALLAVPGLGKQSVLTILNYLRKHEVSWAEFWVNIDQYLTKIAIKENTKASIKQYNKEHTIDSITEGLQKAQVSVVAVWEKDYPLLLRSIENPPPILFYKGTIPQTQWPLAVVGTRRITEYGQWVTKQLVRQLCSLGAVIVSGFMYGADLIAHLTAREVAGKSIAVLGYGFKHVYPRSQSHYLDELISAGHCFMTEYFPDVTPSPGTFICRNRVIAGIATGVLVTEAGAKSGSHSTAGFASEMGRPVFGVPCRFDHVYVEGVKYLVNQGSFLVSSGREIYQQVSSLFGTQFSWEPTLSDNLEVESSQGTSQKSIEQQIIAIILTQACSLEYLVTKLAIQPATLLVSLQKLALQGVIKPQGSQWINGNS